MVATVATVAYLGLEARGVEVQVQLSTGLPAFIIVGLPDKAVAESRERVRAALSAIGLALPPKRITVNLSPADLPKEGSHFDLPIALGLLAAIGATDAEGLSHYIAVGELGLDGRIAASPGVLLAALHASSRDMGLICPAVQGPEAAWAGNVELIAAPDLLALLAHLKGTMLLAPPIPGEAEAVSGGPDLRQVKGQEVAKRALEIAAAGGLGARLPPGAARCPNHRRLGMERASRPHPHRRGAELSQASAEELRSDFDPLRTLLHAAARRKGAQPHLAELPCHHCKCWQTTSSGEAPDGSRF